MITEDWGNERGLHEASVLYRVLSKCQFIEQRGGGEESTRQRPMISVIPDSLLSVGTCRAVCVPLVSSS